MHATNDSGHLAPVHIDSHASGILRKNRTPVPCVICKPQREFVDADGLIDHFRRRHGDIDPVWRRELEAVILRYNTMFESLSGRLV